MPKMLQRIIYGVSILGIIALGGYFIFEKVEKNTEEKVEQEVGAIAQHELLKCAKEDVIDYVDEPNGVVFYVCKKNPLQERNKNDIATTAKNANLAEINKQIEGKLGAISTLSKQKILIENLVVTEEDNSRRTKDTRIFNTNIPGFTVGEISSFPLYYKDEQNNWWYVEYGTTTKQAFDEQIASLSSKIASWLGIEIAHATVGQFITTSTSKDTIMVYNTGASSSWATATGAAAATSITNVHGGANTGINAQEKTTEVDGFSLHRTGFNISISTIDTFDTITAATFEVNVDEKVNEITTNDDNNLFGFTPADPTDVTTADYDQCGSTGLATAINTGSISAGATTTFTYDADGITNIEADKGTWHSICWRHQLDYDSVAPTNDSRNALVMFFYDTAAKAPRLIVTWTEGVAPAASPTVPASAVILDF